MLLLIAAVVLGLAAFSALRAIAGPLAILCLVAFVWTKFVGPTHPVASANSGEPAAQAFVSPYPVPAAERAVCSALEEGDAGFTPLEAQWHAADDTDRSNAVRRQVLVDAAHKRIAELFARRNAKVLALVTAQMPQAAAWVVRLTKIDSAEEDFGTGTKNYIVLSGDLPCAVPTTLTTKDIEGTPEVTANMARLNAGDYVTVSGNFVPHDEEAQGAAAAIEWGGILWGPFGGLWPAAFRAPAFQLDVSDVHRGY
jgi:hypothetical protein